MLILFLSMHHLPDSLQRCSQSVVNIYPWQCIKFCLWRDKSAFRPFVHPSLHCNSLSTRINSFSLSLLLLNPTESWILLLPLQSSVFWPASNSFHHKNGRMAVWHRPIIIVDASLLVKLYDSINDSNAWYYNSANENQPPACAGRGLRTGGDSAIPRL